METIDYWLIAGIVMPCIWLGACIIIEGKNKKIVVNTGIVIDLILFLICRNYELLFFAVLGGLACGFFPGLVSARKYEVAVKELNGVKNWVKVSIIFFVMIFMAIAIIYPDVNIVW